MTPLQQQFEILKMEYEEATLLQLPTGAHLVSIPRVPLPGGWNKGEVTVKFIAPVGYPLARPDCFWSDVDLRLSTGAMPQNSAINVIPEANESSLWFSWHVSQWNPNRDSLSTFTKVIENRFKVIQ